MGLLQYRHGSRESGQVAVETAIIMPLFVFLILGILQLGLMAQARVMAKYAVYRAARVGAMHNASLEAMEQAALFHLMPVLVNKSESILPTGTSSEVLSKYSRTLTEYQKSPTGPKLMKIVICGPTSSELRGTGTSALPKADQRSLGGRGSSNEVDFDDPDLAGTDSPGTGRGMRLYNRLRLRVQLQLLYRMPIPFANWIITRTYLGATLPSVLMMTSKDSVLTTRTEGQAKDVNTLAGMRIYTIPMNVSYAMRMQSNFFLNRNKLPDTNACIHYAP